jgi:hypothetical protein
VQRGLYEADFFRLVQILEVKPDQLERFIAFANQINPIMAEEKDLETQRTEAIALCRRRIQAAIDLYSDGRISRAEYLRRVEGNERESASWQARTIDGEKLGMELTMCIHTVETLVRLWEVSNDEDKQGMARHLFEYVVYNLDTQEIVDFRLKAWADQFLMLRAAHHTEEKTLEFQADDNRVALTGLQPLRRTLRLAA